MFVERIVGAFLVVVGLILVPVALAILFLGAVSARKCVVALVGAETPVRDLHRDDEFRPYAKVTATVLGSDAPVETASEELAPMYRVVARRRNYRRLLNRRRHHDEVLADDVAFERATIRDDDGTRCLLTARPNEDGDRWGDRQRAIGDYEHLLRTTPLLSTTWDAEATYYDDEAVPDHVVAFLDVMGVDTDFGLDRFGVRKLTVHEDVVETGEEIRILGRVERRPVAELAPDAPVPDDSEAVVLRPWTTVTTDSWRALAWNRAKAAAVRLPFAVVLAAAGIVAVYGGLRWVGLL